jgi:hypothetical protein
VESPGVSVTLRAVGVRPWLGQAVTLVAEARDRVSGGPAVAVPLTFLTTWGKLQSSDGSGGAAHPGSVTTRTNLEGRARVRLVPTTDEEPTQDQQASLETALARLGVDPLPTPAEARDALDELARAYRRRENLRLRMAVDLYYDTYESAGRDPVLRRDPFAGWPTIAASVVVHVREGRGAAAGSSVAASAAVTLLFRNWLPAWVAAYREVTEAGAGLDQVLGGVLARGTAPAYVLPAAYGRIDRFVKGELGRVGEQVGRWVAERSIRRVLDKGIAELPLESRLAVRQGLEVAGQAIGTAGGTRVLGGIAGSQEVVRRETPRLDGLELGVLTERLGTLEGTVGGLDQRLASVSADLEQNVVRRDELATLQNRFSSLETAMVTLRNDVEQNLPRRDELSALQTQLASLRDDFERTLPRLDGLTALEARVTASEQQLAGTVDARELASFRTRVLGDLERFDVDIQDLKGRLPR